MAETSTVPPGAEASAGEGWNGLDRTEEDKAVDQFQRTLTERRREDTKRTRTLKDAITGIWLEQKCTYGSPFPRRDSNTYAQWFVDGEDYMEHAANMISLAREEIFITDWWLSPQVYLKRPAVDRKWRFDELLRRKADEGVKIYIQLFKEVEMALGTIKSLESKRILHNLHSNIKVIRHPDRISGVVFWSHHEKILVIDQNIAYVGGLDFAFGRWDTHRHRLADQGPDHLRQVTLPVSGSSAVEGFRAMGKLVPRISEDLVHCIEIGGNNALGSLDEPSTSSQQNAVAEKGMGSSEGAFWDGEKKKVTWSEEVPPEIRNQDLAENRSPDESHSARKQHRRPGVIGRAFGHIRHMYHKQKQRRHLRHDDNVYYDEGWTELATEDSGRRRNVLPGSIMFVGKDYVNFIEKNFVDLDKPEEDFVDRNAVARMPWHDIHSVIYGEAARDVAHHFITRWNSTKASKKKLLDWPSLMLKKMDFSVPQILRKMSYPCKVQVLRSACEWSIPGGITESESGIEDSIHQAYLHMIGNAKHYIYIENQFFVSLMGSDKVTNSICHALCDRIVRAYEEQDAFKVYIVIPLLPNFEGKIGEESGSSLLAVMRWTYDSLCREPHSLFFNLKRQGVENPHRYVSVCSLRNYDVLSENLVTELIYIHSKLIIADDKSAIIGSANINDRSQLGTRDSEIALHIQDQSTEPSVMNGHPFKAGKFCGSLRKSIFREHLGDLETVEPQDPTKYIPVDVSDPLSDQFFENTWKRIAQKNSEIFDQVFRCIPTNKVTSFEALESYRAVAPLCMLDREKAFEMVKGIQGHLVEFPMAFLNRADLAPSIKSKEGLVPYQIFT